MRSDCEVSHFEVWSGSRHLANSDNSSWHNSCTTLINNVSTCLCLAKILPLGVYETEYVFTYYFPHMTLCFSDSAVVVRHSGAQRRVPWHRAHAGWHRQQSDVWEEEEFTFLLAPGHSLITIERDLVLEMFEDQFLPIWPRSFAYWEYLIYYWKASFGDFRSLMLTPRAGQWSQKYHISFSSIPVFPVFYI